MNAWLIAATVLLAGFVPCAFVCLRAPLLHGVAALELAGTLAALVFLLLAQGFDRSAYFGVPVTLSVVALPAALVFVRLLARP